jgi:hypothetical protein
VGPFQSAVSLDYFAYTFSEIHRTLRIASAMAAGVVTRLMDLSDRVAMLEEAEKKAA